MLIKSNELNAQYCPFFNSCMMGQNNIKNNSIIIKSNELNAQVCPFFNGRMMEQINIEKNNSINYGFIYIELNAQDS